MARPVNDFFNRPISPNAPSRKDKFSTEPPPPHSDSSHSYSHSPNPHTKRKSSDQKELTPQQLSAPFTLVRLKGSIIYHPYCESGDTHLTTRTSLAQAQAKKPLPRAATHKLLILGHPTFLCAQCAKKWEDAYNSALSPSPSLSPDSPS